MSKAGGSAEILGEAAAAHRAAADAAQGEQLGLELDQAEQQLLEELAEEDDEDQLPFADAREIAEIQRELDCDVYRAVREHQRRQGKGGRKPGSGNKRNADFRRWLLTMGPHPAAVLARIYGRPTDQLAAQLGCSKTEALDRQIRCADIALPFVEGKMPATMNVNLRGDFALVAGAGTGLFDDIADAEFDELPALGFAEENQDDSGDDAEASD